MSHGMSSCAGQLPPSLAPQGRRGSLWPAPPHVSFPAGSPILGRKLREGLPKI